MKPADAIVPGPSYDVASVRSEFPALHQQVAGKPLVYLDNAATSQKPRQVIEAIDRYYRQDNANVRRGVHELSQRATRAYEGARQTLQRFLGAGDSREVIFVRGATEGINLVAYSYGRSHVGRGDEILVTGMEHHSNIVPWQILCEEKGARLQVAPIGDDGDVLLDQYEALLGPRTRLVSVVHVSNSLGTVNPVSRMIEAAHRRGIPVLVDGAQAGPHLPLDVRALDADFYVLSGHKMYGPTGSGVLYGKRALLEKMPPYQSGGDMIRSVSFERTEYNDLPHRFEAGTPHIAGAIGLAAAVDYLESLGLEAVHDHESALLAYAADLLSAIPGVHILGAPRERAGVLSFVVDGAHPHDVGTILDQEGVAVRAGHHCTQPLMERFGVPATTRASLGVYNNREDIDTLAAAIRRVSEVFGG